MKIIIKISRVAIAMLVAIVAITGAFSKTVFADSEFSVSPMTQRIVLTPGEKYRGTFDVVNPSSNTRNFYYRLDAEPFYVNDDHEAVLENNGDYNQIVDWIVFDKNDGVVKPNSSETIHFTIDVPYTAPAGGQYATIRVTNSENSEEVSGNLNLQNVLSIAHLIYAEVAGDTKIEGEITDADVPSFLLSGNIVGKSVVKNTGNVHGIAKYTMQVFPIFSSEEVYTNEEQPEEKTVMPERKLYHETVWNETPPVGIFNVIYTVEFEGVTTQVSKMVIICPIWLLFIIIFVIIALVIWIVMKIRSKGNKKARRVSESKAE